MTTTTYVLAMLAVGLAAGLAIALVILFSRTDDLNSRLKRVIDREDVQRAAESITKSSDREFRERLYKNIDDLWQGISKLPSAEAVDISIKNEARRRESLEDSLERRIDTVATKVDSALMRLGIDPQTGSALDGATPIDARGPLALAQHALNGGNAAGALGHLLGAVRADLADDIRRNGGLAHALKCAG